MIKKMLRPMICVFLLSIFCTADTAQATMGRNIIGAVIGFAGGFAGVHFYQAHLRTKFLKLVRTENCEEVKTAIALCTSVDLRNYEWDDVDSPVAIALNREKFDAGLVALLLDEGFRVGNLAHLSREVLARVVSQVPQLIPFLASHNAKLSENQLEKAAEPLESHKLLGEFYCDRGLYAIEVNGKSKDRLKELFVLAQEQHCRAVAADINRRIENYGIELGKM